MQTTTARDSARPTLEIDLGALRHNFHATVNAASAPGRTPEGAAVVKCNAYGLGVGEVVGALAQEDACRAFFVAYPEEGLEVRKALARHHRTADVFILNGLCAWSPDRLKSAGLTPVINSLDEATTWAEVCPEIPIPLHVDTGMTRLGVPQAHLDGLRQTPGLKVGLIMSHLACASNPDDPMNRRQRVAFEAAAALFPQARTSLASSDGAFLSPEFAFDMVRVGVALYGVGSFDRPNPALQVVGQLTARVLQVQTAEAGASVGYGATFRTDRPRRLATLAIGYGDGYPRAASNAASVQIGGAPCPVVGRISMDLLTVDVTDAPHSVEPGDAAEVFGPHIRIEHLARDAGTIAYEILTAIHPLIPREYRGLPSS